MSLKLVFAAYNVSASIGRYPLMKVPCLPHSNDLIHFICSRPLSNCVATSVATKSFKGFWAALNTSLARVNITNSHTAAPIECHSFDTSIKLKWPRSKSELTHTHPQTIWPANNGTDTPRIVPKCEQRLIAHSVAKQINQTTRPYNIVSLT